LSYIHTLHSKLTFLFFFYIILHPPRYTLFPYTTLFRSILPKSGKNPFQAKQNTLEEMMKMMQQQMQEMEEFQEQFFRRRKDK